MNKLAPFCTNIYSKNANQLRTCLSGEYNYGYVWGDPHFVGGDGDFFDFQGEDKKKFNIIADTNFFINAQFKEHKVFEGNTTMSKTRIVVQEKANEIDEVPAERTGITLKNDGTANMDGMKLEIGQRYRMADGGFSRLSNLEGSSEAKILKNNKFFPTDRLMKLLEKGALVKAKFYSKTKEGYTVEQYEFSNGETGTAEMKWIELAVRTASIDSGNLPSGLLGQTFDMDLDRIANTDFDGFDFEVDSLAQDPNE